MDKPTCSIDGCEKQAHCRSWCPMHYQRWRTHGDVHHVEPPKGNGKPRRVGIEPCEIPGCERPMKARGWCGMHYHRWRRRGDPQVRMPGEVVDGRRICPGCRNDKLLADYSPNATGQCKRCVADLRGLWRARTPGYWLLHQASPEYFRQYQREWRASNPDRVRQLTAERRARRAGATIEPFSPREVFDRDGWVCGICGIAIDPDVRYPDPASVSLDHIIPLAGGGSHSMSNAQASHLVCNLRKHTRVG